MASNEDELARDYSRRFWDVANLVTGFAIAQFLAYLYLIGSGTYSCIQVKNAVDEVTALLLLFSGIYIWLVFSCHKKEVGLLGDAPAGILQASQQAAWIRAGGIALFGLLSIGNNLRGLSCG